jgi:Ca-activated chloride channel family protein
VVYLARSIADAVLVQAGLDDEMVLKLKLQITIVCVIALLTLAGAYLDRGSMAALWLTPDQQGRLAYDGLEFSDAAALFEDPMWRGIAAYAAGQYDDSAQTFARLPSAIGFYNRGNALLKSRAYGQAPESYQQAANFEPGWKDAGENLELALYIQDYIEGAREASDTGDESELSADGFVFDKKQDGGVEMVITEQSTIEQVSAEKWMRAVDTQTREFLQIRFAIQANQPDRALAPEQTK